MTNDTQQHSLLNKLDLEKVNGGVKTRGPLGPALDPQNTASDLECGSFNSNLQLDSQPIVFVS